MGKLNAFYLTTSILKYILLGAVGATVITTGLSLALYGNLDSINPTKNSEITFRGTAITEENHS